MRRWRRSRLQSQYITAEDSSPVDSTILECYSSAATDQPGGERGIVCYDSVCCSDRGATETAGSPNPPPGGGSSILRDALRIARRAPFLSGMAG